MVMLAPLSWGNAWALSVMWWCRAMCEEAQHFFWSNPGAASGPFPNRPPAAARATDAPLPPAIFWAASCVCSDRRTPTPHVPPIHRTCTHSPSIHPQQAAPPVREVLRRRFTPSSSISLCWIGALRFVPSPSFQGRTTTQQHVHPVLVLGHWWLCGHPGHACQQQWEETDGLDQQRWHVQRYVVRRWRRRGVSSWSTHFDGWEGGRATDTTRLRSE